MIGLKTKGMLANSLQQQLRYGAMVQTGSRGFAGGGPKRAPISPDETEYDLVLVGKYPEKFKHRLVHYLPLAPSLPPMEIHDRWLS